MNPLRLLVLLVSLPLLLGGCGEKEESVAEVKPELEGVENVELEFREDIAYLKGSDTPYTGKFYELYPSGKRNWEGSQKDGKPDGLHKGWHEIGQKEEEVNFKDGKLEGLRRVWHENGQKKAEATYKDGKFDGLEIGWYDNGQKEVEANWRDGGIDGLSLIWYENGQKKGEVTYKDDKRDGLYVGWHENGQKSVEGNFKDGEVVEGSAKYWNSKGEPVDSGEEAFRK